MSIKIRGIEFDTMTEAERRLGISRSTLLRYIAEGFFTKPKIHPQGRKKRVRYFDEDWYRVNERRLRSERGE